MVAKNINSEIITLANSLRAKYQKKLNNTFIWFSLSHDAIGEARNNEDFISQSRIEVPSLRSGKTVKRKKEDLISILTTAYDKELIYTIFSHLTSQMEHFLYELIEGVLLIDNRRIKLKTNKIKFIDSIDVGTILNADGHVDIIKKIIDANLMAVFYASPDKQFEYINTVFSIENDEKLDKYIQKWKEFKAARDIIIHNNGIINELYIKKSGEYARGEVGEELLINKDDVGDLLKYLKSIIGKLCTNIKNTNKNKNKSKD